MTRPIRVVLINAGDCGACAAEVWSAVQGSTDLAWATTPQQANVVALVGSAPASVRAALLTTYTTYIADRLPIVVIGRCAIDGYPFGRGGVATLPEIVIRRRVDGSPPLVDQVIEALLEAAQPQRLGAA